MTSDRTIGPLTGFLAGATGAIVGLLAMRSYWEKAAPLISRSGVQLPPSQQMKGGRESRRALDDISLVGRQHREGESSTAALGRIAYQQVAGDEPSESTETRLSYGVHWGYGILMGGLYGAMRRRAAFPDLTGGVLFSTGLWLLGDELTMPLLGLQNGPTAARLAQHLNRLGAHLAYGAGTAVATQAMLRVLESVETARAGPRPLLDRLP